VPSTDCYQTHSSSCLRVLLALRFSWCRWYISSCKRFGWHYLYLHWQLWLASTDGFFHCVSDSVLARWWHQLYAFIARPTHSCHRIGYPSGVDSVLANSTHSSPCPRNCHCANDSVWAVSSHSSSYCWWYHCSKLHTLFILPSSGWRLTRLEMLPLCRRSSSFYKNRHYIHL